jgi:hypothetical protein
MANLFFSGFPLTGFNLHLIRSFLALGRRNAPRAKKLNSRSSQKRKGRNYTACPPPGDPISRRGDSWGFPKSVALFPPPSKIHRRVRSSGILSPLILQDGAFSTSAAMRLLKALGEKFTS